MTIRTPLLAGTAALALALARPLAGCEPRAEARPAGPATAASSAPTGGTATGAGLIAFVDPKSGALVVPPPADVDVFLRDEQLMNALSTSSEGLREVRRPDGGYGVHLQGRFRFATIATVGPDGRLRTGHANLLPAPVAPGTAGEVKK